jgi:hypothetical protein
MARPRNTAQMREDLEQFLMEMDFLFEDLEKAMSGTAHAGGVAFDDVSLARVEAFYLNVLAGKLVTTMQSEQLDRCIAAFYGEAMRVRAGRGTWVLSEEVDLIGTPVVAGWGDGAVDFSPVTSRDLQKSDRKPFIVGCVDYAVNRDQIHANFFDEFE